MAYYTSDASFFVEDDSLFTQPRMSTQEAARIIASNRQDMIGNELSRLAGDEYLEDIMQHIRNMEVNILVQWACVKFLLTLIRTKHFPTSTSLTCSARSSGTCGRTSSTF